MPSGESAPGRPAETGKPDRETTAEGGAGVRPEAGKREPRPERDQPRERDKTRDHTKPRERAEPGPKSTRKPERDRPAEAAPRHQPWAPEYEPYEEPAGPRLNPKPDHTLTYVPDAASGDHRAAAPSTSAAERVLPFGTGMTLVGLGLGFIALRLRRRT